MPTGGDPDCQQTASHLLSTWIGENAYIRWFWYLKSLVRKSGGSLGIRKPIVFISWISWIRCWPSQVCGKIFLEFWSSHSDAQNLGRQCQLQGKNSSSYSIFNSNLFFAVFCLICRSQNGRLFTPIFEMCGGFGPTMNIWYKGQMALGESWWILALADGMWLANDRAFLCPLVATSRRNSQINRWMAARTPGVPSLKVRKCVLLLFFFLKFFHIYGPMMDPMYAWRLVKKNHVWSYSPIFLGFPASRLFPPCGFCWRVDRGWFFGGQNRRNFLQKKNKVTFWFLEDWRIDTLNPLVNESFSLKECGGCESLLNLGFHIRHPAKRQFFHVLHTQKYFFYADALANQRHAL